MEDDEKTRAELVAELAELRQRMGRLERQLARCQGEDGFLPAAPAERPERTEMPTHVHVIPDFDIVEAEGINISDGGICFAIDEDLPFELRFELGGEQHMHRAHLVWVKRRPTDGYHFGFMFVRRPLHAAIR